MRILNTAMLLLALLTLPATSQTNHYWIVLRSKDVSSSLQQNARYLGITERALERRAKSITSDRLIDEFDFPISESALTQIKQTGAKIRVISRWLNAVSVEASPKQLQMINAFPMVSRSEPVGQLRLPRPLTSSIPPPPLVKSSNLKVLDYGFSETQLSNMRVVDLHEIGVNGNGVLIGMIDDGFNNYRTHLALKNIKVVADSDFIHNISDVNRQPWENSVQGNHGAGTLSAAGGFDNGHMIGAAYGSSFLLAKTEMDSSGNSTDFNSEEDTYVAGLEWAERLGADITSSSLGYKEFLSTPTYTTADMNGKTTKVAKAAVIASRKGVLVVTAMGNDGYIAGKGSLSHRVEETLISPADADSIISVGAASSDGELAAFSGCGPTADGRIKPEVIAQGLGVYWADGGTSYSYANGTSCSTPLVAGAAALILSAHPELTNMQVRDALMRTTVQKKDGTSETAVYPNNFYGSGFIDAYSAALSLGPVFSNVPEVTVQDSQLVVSTFIVSKPGILKDSLFLHYRIDGGTFSQEHLQATNTPNEYRATIPLFTKEGSVVGYFSVCDSAGSRYNYPHTGTMLLLLRQEPILPQNYVLMQNYPNPFYSTNGTTFQFGSSGEDEVEMTIFNILGQHVKTIFHGHALAGINILKYDGTDESGRSIASGVYFARLKTRNSISSIKMLYLK